MLNTIMAYFDQYVAPVTLVIFLFILIVVLHTATQRVLNLTSRRDAEKTFVITDLLSLACWTALLVHYFRSSAHPLLTFLACCFIAIYVAQFLKHLRNYQELRPLALPPASEDLCDPQTPQPFPKD